MFSNAKVGDRVYSYKWNEFGKITKWVGDFQLCWCAQLDSGKTINFDCCGRELSEWQPTVFWDKIQFEIPQKPFDLKSEYKRLRKKEFVQGEKNYNITIHWTCTERKWGCYGEKNTQAIGERYYEEDYINDFVNLLNDNEITFEQLEQVIKEVEDEEV